MPMAAFLLPAAMLIRVMFVVLTLALKIQGFVSVNLLMPSVRSSPILTALSAPAARPLNVTDSPSSGNDSAVPKKGAREK